jgi:type IV secretion system protein VirB5
MRDNWLSAYDFVTKRGAIFLGEYARANDPFAQVGRRTVSVQVTSVVRASDRSFQVKWTESIFERGSLASVSHWTAILSLEMRAPRSADTLRRNPLGLYVDAIDWSKELEPANESRAPTRGGPGGAAEAPPAVTPQSEPLDTNIAAPAAAFIPERTAR